VEVHSISHLKEKVICIYLCLEYALSDPSDKDLQFKCTHEHIKGDVVIGKCDGIFERLREETAAMYESMDKSTVVTLKDGSHCPATLESILNGYGCFKFTDDKQDAPKETRMSWIECDMAKNTICINKLGLWDTLHSIQKSQELF